MDYQKTKKCRRKAPRIDKHVSLNVTKLQYPVTDAEMKTAITDNVSETGLCFTAEAPYSNGTVLQLVIDLQGWQHYIQNTSAIVDTGIAVKPLTALAEVIWSAKPDGKDTYTVGVLFKDIYEDDLRAFKQYLGQMLGNEVK